MTTRELATTILIALAAAGTTFTGTSIADVGWQGAFMGAGSAFFGTVSALIVALGYDPRRRQEAAIETLDGMVLALSDEEVERIATAVARRQQGVRPREAISAR